MDNICYFIFAQKEPDYTSMILSTYGCLMEQGKHQSHRMKDGVKTFSVPTNASSITSATNMSLMTITISA